MDIHNKPTLNIIAQYFHHISLMGYCLIYTSNLHSMARLINRCHASQFISQKHVYVCNKETAKLLSFEKLLGM